VIIDVDPEKVRRMNAGQSSLFEPGLDEALQLAVQRELLSASESYEAVASCDAVFIAVGTPSGEDGEADLSGVKAAARSIALHVNPRSFTVVVNKSTVPAGTADLVGALIEEASGLSRGVHFAVVSNPEFLREGYALEDVHAPDRIVIGTNDERARRLMRELYRPLLAGGKPSTPYFETDAKSAELIKYVSNAFLAVKISYINEVARLCEKLGANVLDVAKGMGLDSRIGSKFLQVSSGWSGSCFPKDTAELLATSRKSGRELSIVNAAVEANRGMHEYCIEKLRRKLKTLNGKTIGVLGLTFKPNTDDARQTQASTIVARLVAMGASVSAHDPKGMQMFRRLNGALPIRYCETAEETAMRADAILLLTHWEAYGSLNWLAMANAMNNRYVLDTRNFLDRESLRQCGFDYEGLGM
jgi:UDPglucose 6-dehydrogenase